MKNILILIVISVLAACSSNSTQSNHDTTIVDYTVKQGEPLPSKEWHCYNIDEDKICAPEAWGFVRQDNFFFMSDLSQDAPGSYFVVVKQDKKATGLDTRNYLKKLYTELKQDSSGTLTEWQAIETTYADKKVMSSEYNILIGKESYMVYSTVFEIGNYLYDMSLKMSATKAKTYNEIYKNVVFNFYHENKQVFTSNDKVVGAKIIDLTKL